MNDYFIKLRYHSHVLIYSLLNSFVKKLFFFKIQNILKNTKSEFKFIRQGSLNLASCLVTLIFSFLKRA